MKQLYPDLWQTTRQTQFSTLTVHAYLLRRAGGNVLFYNPRSTDDCPQMANWRPDTQALAWSTHVPPWPLGPGPQPGSLHLPHPIRSDTRKNRDPLHEHPLR